MVKSNKTRNKKTRNKKTRNKKTRNKKKKTRESMRDKLLKKSKEEYIKNKPIAKNFIILMKKIIKDMKKMNIEASLFGLMYKLKSQKSLADKYSRIMKRQNVTLNEATKLVKDGIRFTIVFPKEKYVDGVLNVWSQLLKNDFNSITRKGKDEIRWDVGDGYQGINTLISNDNDTSIEIQFHTKNSIKYKDKLLHPLYEKLRKNCDEKLSLKEMEEKLKKSNINPKCISYKKDLIRAEKKIPIPERIKKCKSLKKKNNRINDLKSCQFIT